MQCSAPPGYGDIHRQMRPAKAGTTACWSQWRSRPPWIGSRLSASSIPQLQFVKGDRREEQAAVPRQSAPCATPTQGWYQPDPSEEISRPGQLPVVRQGEIEILHAGHGEQVGDRQQHMGRAPPVGDEHRPLVGGPLGGRRLQALAAMRGPQRRLSWRMATFASPRALEPEPESGDALAGRSERVGAVLGRLRQLGGTWWETADDRHSLCGRARAPRKATVAPPMGSWLK